MPPLWVATAPLSEPCRVFAIRVQGFCKKGAPFGERGCRPIFVSPRRTIFVSPRKAITDKQVLRFSYKRFGQEPFDLIFHPQYLKEYNGRWFVFGEANRDPFHAYNVPLDRIVGGLSIVEDVEYIPAEKGFYQDFFKNIIGVTHEKDAQVEKVVIRTKTEYQHGLLLTKPLHHSQKEALPFGEHADGCYGVVTLTIEPNRELRGRILMYGESLEVMSPLSLREQILDIIKQQLEAYSAD